MKATAPVCLLLSLPFLMHGADNYTAKKVSVDGFEVVELSDAARKTTVRIVPAMGNNSYEMKVNGVNVFFSPYQSLSEFKAKPTLLGNPFLGPWANRLDSDGYWANGRRYQLNPELKNFNRAQAGKPIHGLLQYASEWKVINVTSGKDSAAATSRLEFWRRPDWMAQFPFAHVIEMSYRLSNGVLEVDTTVENLSTEAMPLSIAYHPYFTLTDAPRDEWLVSIPAKARYTLNEALLPTGETNPNAYPNPLPLKDTQLDDVFGGLQAASDGRTTFAVQGRNQKISVVFGPKYPVAVVYAPKGRPFVCFEPMTGPTNAFNLAHEGKYKGLQTISPGSKWRESYWIAPSGF